MLEEANFGKKGEAKTRIFNALWGLVLALGSVILLQTINPDILNLSLSNITPTSISISDLEADNPPGGNVSNCTPPPNTEASCIDCVDGSSQIDFKSSSGKLINKELLAKLIELKKQPQIKPWRISEAYKAQPIHCTQGHYTGKVVDLNFSNTADATAVNVANLIAETQKLGIPFKYEASTTTINEFKKSESPLVKQYLKEGNVMYATKQQ